jgi:hypothetical protein
MIGEGSADSTEYGGGASVESSSVEIRSTGEVGIF